MSTQIQHQSASDTFSPPGETLEEALAERAMSQAQLAQRTGRPKKTINEIVRGKAAITPETALQLERVLGVPAAFWMAREQNYRESLARAREAREFGKQTAWLDQVPYRAMIKLGWIPERRERIRQLDELLRFFAVASPASWKIVWAETSMRAPKSKPGALAAWLRKGEIEADRQHPREYDAGAFRRALGRVRSLTRNLPEAFAPAVTRYCNNAGVCLAFVPELPGARVSGTTRWLAPSRPLIQLSLRHKTGDQLRLAFFHAAGHILLHGRRDTFLEGGGRERDNRESEADAFARDWLTPKIDVE